MKQTLCETKLILDFFLRLKLKIESPVETHKKLIPEKIKGLQQFRDHHWKALDEENSNLIWLFLKNLFLTSFFIITFQIMPKQKYTTQNWIHLIKYSCSEVSDPSEAPRFKRESIFKAVKEVKLIFMRSIISCLRVPAIFEYACINFFFDYHKFIIPS